jgi:hypothetical protein
MERTIIDTIPSILVVTFVTLLIPTSVITQIAATLPTINTNSSVSFSLSKAYVGRNIVYFIATDASNN